MNGNKLYSLMATDDKGCCYLIKINDNYKQSLAFIDAYITSHIPDKENLCAGLSYKLRTNIVDAFITYKVNGKTKAIEPSFTNNQEIKLISSAYQKYDDENDLFISTNKVLFDGTNKLLKFYFANEFVRQTLDRYADAMLVSDLRNQYKTSVVRHLQNYRTFRDAFMILDNCLSFGYYIAPKVIDLDGVNIIKSEERELELINEEIDKVQMVMSCNSELDLTNSLKGLFEKRTMLEEGLYGKAITNDDYKQMRLF